MTNSKENRLMRTFIVTIFKTGTKVVERQLLVDAKNAASVNRMFSPNFSGRYKVVESTANGELGA